MTHLDVELARTIADHVAEQSGRRQAWTTRGTSAAAWLVLLVSLAVLLAR